MKAGRLVTSVLILLCICTVIRSVYYIRGQYKWSPIDEFAHMDYVEKVSEGRLPRFTDTISAELFQSILTDTARTLQKNIHSRADLGLGNYSYEAYHPPLYYGLLAVPDIVMKKAGTGIVYRMNVLRLFSYFLFVTGMLLCIPVFNALRKLGFALPEAYAWGCVLFGLLIATNQRYGLGNNMLSPLVVNSCIYFLLQYHIRPSQRNLYLFILFACLSVFAAISNLFLVPVLALFILKKYSKNFSWKSLFYGSVILLVFAFLFYSWKKATVPNPFIDAYIHAGLSFMIPAGKFRYAVFWQLLSEDMLTLSFIKEKLNIAWYVAGLFFLSNMICLLYIRSVFRRHTWLLAVAALCAEFLVWTFFLNKYVPAVYWDAFRHYLGFIPVLYVACTAFVPVVYAEYRRSALS